ncbi:MULTISPECIES: recombination regulator RecX [Streptomyces]|uniref:recombination regulator RecX n=1 Tax=Streptomyces TaxID=1883 RepID=UPI0005631763|nr:MULTISPECIES: recombination regulator RecX [Streptomyces]MYT08821.1 recombination regulator RecX [Streptomyces sp. SID5470]
MTRRTDWAEYEDAPRGWGGRGDGGSAGPGGDGHGDGTGHGTDGGYGRSVSHGAEEVFGDDFAHGTGSSYRGGRSHSDGGTFGDGGPSGEESGDGATRGSGAFGRSSRRGGGAPGAGGPRGRRQRRRGFGESPGEDGGGPSLSRAEKGEPPADPVERARGICLRLLTGTPRTRKQLADALRKREIPDDVAEEVLSRFEEVGLINDSAFADAWVESRHHGRGLARRALAQELRTKGVDSTLIDAAVSQLDSEQEEETARELVDRKLRATRGLDRDKRLRRLAGMLARKGYSEGMALRVVRQALEEEGEETEFLGDEGF